MIGATSRRTVLRDIAVMVFMLLSLWLGPRPAAAGELIEIPVVLRPGLTLPDLSGKPRNLGELVPAVHRGVAGSSAIDRGNGGQALCRDWRERR